MTNTVHITTVSLIPLKWPIIHSLQDSGSRFQSSPKTNKVSWFLFFAFCFCFVLTATAHYLLLTAVLFFCCCDKTPWLRQLVNGRAYLDFWFQRDTSPSWQGRGRTASCGHGSKSRKLRAHILTLSMK